MENARQYVTAFIFATNQELWMRLIIVQYLIRYFNFNET